MVEYYKKVFRAAWTDFLCATREQVIGALIGVGILIYQIHYGLIKVNDIAANLWSIAWPYTILVAGFLVYHLVRVPKKLDDDRQRELNIAHVATVKAQYELQAEMDRHGGPEMSLVWAAGQLTKDNLTMHQLQLENSGTIDAYDVQVEDVGLDKIRCRATFPKVAKCLKGSRTDLPFNLLGTDVPPSHKDEFEMVVYASGKEVEIDSNNHSYVEFPIDITFDKC